MNRQDKVLVWLAEAHSEEDFPKKTGQLYEKYQRMRDYDKSKPAFSEILGKLKEKGLITSPNYGEYSLTERGWTKAEHLESEPSEHPPGYEALVEVLKEFRKNSEGDRIRLSKLKKFNQDVLDDLESNPDIFLEALEEAYSTVPQVENDIFELTYEIPQLRNSKHKDNFIAVEGVIQELSDKYSRKTEEKIECPECGRSYTYKPHINSERPKKCSCGYKTKKVNQEFKEAVDFSIKNGSEKIDCVNMFIPGDDLLKLGENVKATGILRFPDEDDTKPFIEIFNLEESYAEPKLSEEDRKRIKKKINEISNDKSPLEIFANSISPEVNGRQTAKKLVAASIIGSPDIDFSVLLVDQTAGSDAMMRLISGKISEAVHGSGHVLPEKLEDNSGFKAGSILLSRSGVLCIQGFDKLDQESQREVDSVINTGFFSHKGQEFKVENNIVSSSRTEHDNFDAVHLISEDERKESLDEQESMFESELDLYLEVAKNYSPELGKDAKDYLSSKKEELSSKEWNSVVSLTKIFARSRLSDTADIGDSEHALSLFNEISSV